MKDFWNISILVQLMLEKNNASNFINNITLFVNKVATLINLPAMFIPPPTSAYVLLLNCVSGHFISV